MKIVYYEFYLFDKFVVIELKFFTYMSIMNIIKI